jgi:hypothetical protein
VWPQIHRSMHISACGHFNQIFADVLVNKQLSSYLSVEIVTSVLYFKLEIQALLSQL